MKKIGLAILIACTAWGAFAQKDPFMPPTAVTMGQGGAFTAVANGYNAFFYNPAGFARKGEFTLLSANVYGVMDRTLYDMMADAAHQYVGNGKGAGSAGRDFSITQFYTGNVNTLSGSVNNLYTYIQSANATQLQTAIDNTPGLGAMLAASGVASGQALDSSQAAQYLGAILANDPSQVSAMLTSFVSALGSAGATGTPPTAGDLATIGSAVTEINDNIKKQFPSGNMDVGAVVGIGWAGKGGGLGLFADVDASVFTPEGKSLLSGVGRVTNTISLVGGLGFNVFKGFDIGFSIRPTILGYANVNSATIMSAIPGLSGSSSGDIISQLFSDGIYKGFYIGVDVGALWDVGPFTFGLAVKDLIPYQIAYTRYDDPYVYVANLFKLTGASYSASSYQVPWGKINVGVSWHPDLGETSKLFDPRISFDIHDLLGFLRYTDADQRNSLHQWGWLDLINVGANVDLLGFLSLRAGFSQGMWTGGLGIKLLVMEINTAFGARYRDGFSSLNDFSEVGFSFEIAILRI